MSLKEFFKPTKGKLVIPIAVLLFFLIILSINYNDTQKTGKAWCEINKNYVIPMLKAEITNDTETAKKIENQENEYRFRQQTPEATIFFLENGIAFLKKISVFNINPDYSIDCEVSGEFCPYHKEKYFECIRTTSKEISELKIQTGSFDSSFDAPPEDYDNLKYNPQHLRYILNIILNLGFLIITTYILSCALVFLYKKIRKKP